MIARRTPPGRPDRLLPALVMAGHGGLTRGWPGGTAPRLPMITGLTLAAAGAAVIATVSAASPPGVLVVSVAAASLLAAVGLAWTATSPGSMG